MIGRNTGTRSEVAIAAPSPIPSPTASPTPAPLVPAVTPTLGRGDLLQAARAATDAFASGRPLSPEVVALNGRRFELRLPFGCRGPAPADASLGWRYDEESGTLRVSVGPDRFEPASWLTAEAAADIDLVEGFWIERPWTSSEACPPIPSNPVTDVAPAPSPERTFALAQFHGTGESRVGRRNGEAYKLVEKIAPDALNLTQGLQLRLTGRIVAAPGGAGSVLCRPPAQADRRPVCLISVSLEEVAIENPATTSTLATWEVSNARVADN